MNREELRELALVGWRSALVLAVAHSGASTERVAREAIEKIEADAASAESEDVGVLIDLAAELLAKGLRLYQLKPRRGAQLEALRSLEVALANVEAFRTKRSAERRGHGSQKR